MFDDVRAGEHVPAAEVQAGAPRRAAPHQQRRAVDRFCARRHCIFKSFYLFVKILINYFVCDVL